MANKQDMSKRIKRAIISLSDKSEIKLILNTLKKYRVDVISSGGTSKKIKKLGYICTEVSEYGVIHQRNIEFDINKFTLFGKEKLIKKNNFKVSNFEIRFHLLPNIKVTKLQDNKSVLIELENSGWRFFSNDGLIGVETGLYFGDKNKYIENQNIFISGITQNNEQLIEWQISKI